MENDRVWLLKLLGLLRINKFMVEIMFDWYGHYWEFTGIYLVI